MPPGYGEGNTGPQNAKHGAIHFNGECGCSECGSMIHGLAKIEAAARWA